MSLELAMLVEQFIGTKLVAIRQNGENSLNLQYKKTPEINMSTKNGVATIRQGAVKHTCSVHNTTDLDIISTKFEVARGKQGKRKEPNSNKNLYTKSVITALISTGVYDLDIDSTAELTIISSNGKDLLHVSKTDATVDPTEGGKSIKMPITVSVRADRAMEELGLTDTLTYNQYVVKLISMEYLSKYVPYFTTIELQGGDRANTMSFKNETQSLLVDCTAAGTLKSGVVRLEGYGGVSIRSNFNTTITLADVTFLEKYKQVEAELTNFCTSKVLESTLSTIFSIHLFKGLQAIDYMADRINVQVNNTTESLYIEKEDSHYFLVSDNNRVKLEL